MRRRYRRIRLLAGSWVQHWIAVAAERLHHWKADLKLILLAMICLLGYFIRNPELFNRNHSFITILFTELIATV